MAARRSYTAAFKLNVVAYAKEMGNRAAGTLFCVNEKQIRYWKKQEDLLRVSHKSKRANRGGAARWSLLEDLLESWVLEQVAQGRTRLCTSRVIVQKAKAIAREKNIQGFIGGSSWCLRFLRRKKLLFVNAKSRNKMTTGNLQQPRQHCAAAEENLQLQQQPSAAAIAAENSYNNNLSCSINNEDLNNFNLMISSGDQMKNISQMQLDPKEILLSNCEEQLDLASNDIRNEKKEISQEEQEDCNLRMIETENPPLEKSESVVMHTCPPISSKRLLVVPDHQHSLMSSLASMWKEQKMCDASIGNGTTIIKVHKVILLAISSTLLSSSEVKTNCFLRVNFPSNISENAMKAFAEYMYNGVFDLDPLTLIQLQQISYQLGIKNLQLLCENQLFAQSQSSRSIDNIIFPGVSLSHLAAQPESLESVSLQSHHHSEPDFRKRTSQTNSYSPLSTDQEFSMHNPVLLKTEPQSSIQADSLGYSRLAKAIACPFDETSHSQRPGAASGTKPSQISKMIQDQAIKSQLSNPIKIEPVDHSKSEYNQRLTFPKTNLTCLNSQDSDSCKLNSISVYPKFTRNTINPLASTGPLALSESNVPTSSCDKSIMFNQSETNSINSIERSALPTTDKPYPVMLFSSEVSNLPISKTINNKPYVNLKS